ncbi:hypothetical protein ACFQPG_00400 [Sphingomonas sp. GCM10030256]|uniref:hypothetical protein n=1 Tax=Sphingomonas sp. GCM10030256 TaxID=3273427 RepID=UPI0036108ED6
MRVATFIALSLAYAVAAFFLIQMYALRCGVGFADERCVRPVEARWPYVLGGLIILYAACSLLFWRRGRRS